MDQLTSRLDFQTMLMGKKEPSSTPAKGILKRKNSLSLKRENVQFCEDFNPAASSTQVDFGRPSLQLNDSDTSSKDDTSKTLKRKHNDEDAKGKKKDEKSKKPKSKNKVSKFEESLIRRLLEEDEFDGKSKKERKSSESNPSESEDIKNKLQKKKAKKNVSHFQEHKNQRDEDDSESSLFGLDEDSKNLSKQHRNQNDSESTALESEKEMTNLSRKQKKSSKVEKRNSSFNISILRKKGSKQSRASDSEEGMNILSQEGKKLHKSEKKKQPLDLNEKDTSLSSETETEELSQKSKEKTNSLNISLTAKKSSLDTSTSSKSSKKNISSTLLNRSSIKKSLSQSNTSSDDESVDNLILSQSKLEKLKELNCSRQKSEISESQLRHFEETNEKLSRITTNLNLNIEPSDDIYLIQIPKRFNPHHLIGEKISLNKTTKIKEEGKKYDCIPTQKPQDPISLFSNHLHFINLNGTIKIQRHIKSVHLPELPNTWESSVAFPENLKERHPLFGANYSDKISLEEHVQQKLQAAIESYNKQKKKKKKKRVKIEKTEEKEEEIFNLLNQSSTSDFFSQKVKESSQLGEEKKKKKKHKEEQNISLDPSMNKNKKRLEENVNQGALDVEERPKKKHRKDEDHINEMLVAQMEQLSSKSKEKKRLFSERSEDDDAPRKKKHKKDKSWLHV